MNDKKINRQIFAFIILTFLLSFPFYYIMIKAGSMWIQGGIYTYVIHLIPGISAILVCLFYKDNFKIFSLKWGKTKFHLIAYIMPIIYGAIVYGLIWITRLGGFKEYENNIIIYLVFSTILWSIWTLGAELGWRGYLVSKLINKYSFGKTVIISGLIWGIWNWPLILFTDFAEGIPKLYSFTFFTISIIAFSFPLTWFRLKNKSIFTAMFLHTSHNVFVGLFHGMTIDTGITKYIYGESGVALSIITIIIAYIFWRLRVQINN